jgi:hypothetical protein
LYNNININCQTPVYSSLPFGGGLGRGAGYMMKYIKPALKVEEAEVVNMLAESLIIDNDTTVSGDDALTKEDSWEIWSDDEDAE